MRKLTNKQIKQIIIRDMYCYTEMLLTSILRDSYFNYDLCDEIINEIEHITKKENIKELKNILNKIDFNNLTEHKINNKIVYNDKKFTRKDAYKFLKIVFDITNNYIKTHIHYNNLAKTHEKQINEINNKLIELSKYDS